MSEGGIVRTSGFAPSAPATYYDLLRCADGPAGKPPLVMVHGAGHSGACWLQTPDGRPGWAPYFARRGHAVYLPDWPGTGRSGRIDPARLTGQVVADGIGALLETLDGPAVLMTHSMSGAYGWKVLERHAPRLRAVIGVAASEPGNEQAVPPVLEEGDGYVVVRRGQFDRRVDLDRPRLFEDTIVMDKLIGKGSTQFPREALDAYKRTLMETPARLAYERSNVGGSQLRIEDFGAMAGVPILMVTAEADPDHTRESDRAIVDFFAANGLDAELCYLPEHGIWGNGHMMMLEKNSDDIAALVAGWIDGRVG